MLSPPERSLILRQPVRAIAFLAVVVLSSSALFGAAPPKVTLLDLARQKFGPRTLTNAEINLFAATEKGEEASARSHDPKQNDPTDAANWPADRVVHAECLEWLCSDREAALLVSSRGIKIYGVRIDGNIDLNHAVIRFPLNAESCAFNGDISAKFARLQMFRLANCSVRLLDFEGIHVSRSILLGGTVAEAIVLLNAVIDGNLECDAARLIGAEIVGCDRIALNAEGAKISGRVFLSNALVERGEVRFLGATIGGSLECDGARLVNPKGETLDADGVRINGRAFLRNGFKSEGMVDLTEATIGGSLECEGAQLINPNGRALRADRVRINGNVVFRKVVTAEGEADFRAEGEVRFVGATIIGNLECDGAQFINRNGRALDADTATISGNIFLRNGLRADGSINLVGANVGVSLTCTNASFSDNAALDLRAAKAAVLRDDEFSWPSEGNLFLDGFSYDRIADEAPVDAGGRVKWLQRQSRNRFLPQPYEQLASVLRNMGHDGEARRVMIEKNRDHARYLGEYGGNGRFFLGDWWWLNVFGPLSGYGYAPMRAFYISLVWIVLGYVLFKKGYSGPGQLILPIDQKAYVKDGAGKIVLKNGRRTFSEEYPEFNALFYSLESFMPFLKLDQALNWAPRGFLRIYLRVHIIAGWFFTTLWVGAVTGLVKS
jgi:hypothetical protein